ncbi:larval cuticle protein A3A-like [Palaemon carinicauda]|uniref:larval cuticle protein A3A-like n=1 Tax=Palaemon carinicauda TaxID=392227 RepID=UPI0035B5767E
MKAVAAIICIIGITCAAPQGDYDSSFPIAPSTQLFAATPAQYEFHYDVGDQYSGNFYGHSEVRDGAVTQGSYYVQLPDSRLMKVDYVADEFGYHPTITYEGQAQYPPQQDFFPHTKDDAILTPGSGSIPSPISSRAPIGTSQPSIVPRHFHDLARPFLGVSPVPNELLSFPNNNKPLLGLHGSPAPFLHSSPVLTFRDTAPLLGQA